MQFSRHLYAIAGILVILTAASLGAGGKAAVKSQPMQVFVTNSTSSPVNTKAVGTTPVSGTVTIGNSSAIVVHNDSDDRVPIQLVVNAHLDSGEESVSGGMYTVPAGKMLVMETEAVYGGLSSTDSLTASGFSLSGGFEFVPIKFSLDNSSQFGNTFSGVSTGKYYFKEGSIILYYTGRSNITDAANIQIQFSGYLVPMPSSAP